MLELGWSEIFVVAVLAIILVGPEQLPDVMRTMGRVFKRIYYIKYAFSRQFEDFLHQSDLDELRKAVNFEQKDFNEQDADEAYLVEESNVIEEGKDEQKPV